MTGRTFIIKHGGDDLEELLMDKIRGYNTKGKPAKSYRKALARKAKRKFNRNKDYEDY